LCVFYWGGFQQNFEVTLELIPNRTFRYLTIDVGSLLPFGQKMLALFVRSGYAGPQHGRAMQSGADDYVHANNVGNQVYTSYRLQIRTLANDPNQFYVSYDGLTLRCLAI